MWSFKLQMIGMAVVLSFSLVAAIFTIVSKKMPMLVKVYAIIVFLLALWLAVRRDTYLPFLGHAALPPTVFRDNSAPADANIYVSLPFDVPDGTKVVYWGAKPTKVTLPNPWDAYDHYQNAGVTEVRGGKASMRFHCPSKYKIPSGQTLNRHIHYRIVSNNGIVGPVQTTYVDC